MEQKPITRYASERRLVRRKERAVEIQTQKDSEKGLEFMAELLRRLMNNSSGDILYICIHGAAGKVGIDPKDADRLLKLAIKDRNANNPFAHFGFFQ